MHKDSLVDIFNAGMVVRGMLVKQRYYRQSRERQFVMLQALHRELNLLFGFQCNGEDLYLESTRVHEFLVRYAERYVVVNDDILFDNFDSGYCWASSVFFAASYVIFRQSYTKGYIAPAPFLQCIGSVDLTDPAIYADQWYTLFEQYLWQISTYTTVAAMVAGNVRMSTVFNSVVPADQAIEVYDEDAVPVQEAVQPAVDEPSPSISIQQEDTWNDDPDA